MFVYVMSWQRDLIIRMRVWRRLRQSRCASQSRKRRLTAANGLKQGLPHLMDISYVNYHVHVSTKLVFSVCTFTSTWLCRARLSGNMCGIGQFSFSDMHRITPELLAVCVPHICNRTHHITIIITHLIALRFLLMFYFFKCKF